MDDASELRLSEMRRPYGRDRLAEGDLAAEPVDLFNSWLTAALAAGVVQPNAMVLATASNDGRPSLRTVLLKSVDRRGFVFYTNLGSRKSAELAGNPAVALLFAWLPCERQVVVTGRASRLPAEEAAGYFATRPRGAQLGAWASPQSQVIPDRAWLERRVADAERRFAGREVPMPAFWGGFRVTPQTVEFWQGGADRLHDRLRYRRDGAGWVVERLAP